MDSSGVKADRLFVLEQGQRLSDSLLWSLQRSFFEQQGVDAWRLGIVPHYVTSNPFIAETYARLVFAFLQDCPASAEVEAATGSPDPDHRVYIIELGSGSGRFAYRFLKKFLEISSEPVLKKFQFTYVMTDYARANLDFWQNHPSLKPYLEKNLLDFSLFNAGRDEKLTLINSGRTLSPETLKNPLIILANYLFDSLPQDLFTLKEGQLYESQVTLNSSQVENDLTDPAILSRLKLSYSQQPAKVNYYDDPVCNRILEEYREGLPDTAFLFPTSAICSINDLSRLSKGPFMLLAADKGYTREEELKSEALPELSLHGSFSLPVNFHALGQYVLYRGGKILHPEHRYTGLNISAFFLNQDSEDLVETTREYNRGVEQFGPDDFFTLKKGVEGIYHSFTTFELLAFLRLAKWDSTVFLDCYPHFMARAESFSEVERSELYWVIFQVWDTYYPLGVEPDLAFNLGRLLLEMGFWGEALDFFDQSLQLYGPSANTAYNMGLCYYKLGELKDALAGINLALELDPGLETAKQTRATLLGEMESPN